MVAGIKTRAFLVGCARSGCFRQCFFAHSEIYSFPETNFFLSLFGARDLLTMGTTPQDSVRKFRELVRSIMELLGVAEYRRRASAWEPMLLLPNFYVAARCNSISLRHNVKTFVQIVDAASLKAGRPIWVEKTPDHLFYVKRVQQYIPDAAFIHIIRNGRLAVRRWNVALRESLQYRGDRQHYLVRYEELVSDPGKVLKGLCGFLGCDFDVKMVEDYSDNTADTKFRDLFSLAEQDFILSSLKDRK